MLLLSWATQGWSQGLQERNWYFGNGIRGIQFSRPDFKPTLVTRPAVAYGNGGGAVASDANTGNLLFYTDGDQVYDASHTAMPNSGLGGNNLINQPVVICPVPGTSNQYYVFTITAGGTVEQATVDMTVTGNAFFPSPPLGDVTNKNIPTGITNSSEAMIVIPNSNGDDSWLITQTANSDSYTVTAITSGGLVSNTFPGSGIPLTAANFAYNESSGKLAVSPSDPNTNIVIFDFNPTTGALSFDQTILNTGTANTGIYDVEWSFNGQYLYVSRTGDPTIPVDADVLQYDLLANPATSPISILPPDLDIVKSFGLQMGPDSSIYHIYQTSGNQFLMAKISDTDSIASKVVYTPEAFKNGNASINFNATQFPSFSPPAVTNYTISFSPTGSCTNSPITFFSTVMPAADSVVWDYGDGSPPETSWSPVHTFTSTNSTVTATAYVNGNPVATTSQSLTLTQFDVTLTVQSDTTACSCELIYPKAPNPPPHCKDFTIEPQMSGSGTPTYQWFGPSGLLAGKTSLTLDKVDSAGYYYVVATVNSGGVSCSVSAGQSVHEYHVQDMRANIWYFGNAAGINFNPLFYTPPKNKPAQPITGPIYADEGVAVICDQNGQIILSTDGYQVYDRLGNPLIPSAPIPPPAVNPSATQSALIIPVQGDQTLYYIFTSEPVEGGTFRVSYMLFDLKLGTIGGIVDPDVDPSTDPRITLFAKSTERLTGNNAWMIAHEYGNNAFRAYPVGANGIGAPVITDIGSDHSFSSAQSAQGYMKLGAQNRLAVALNDGSSNLIELFDFIDSTGVLTNYRKIDLNDPAGQIYGIEFSPGGNKIYATVKNGATSVIYEYAIDSLGVTTFLQKTPPIAGELGELQIGPDGQIYIAVNGSPSLLSFAPDEDITRPTAALNNLQTFSLADPISGSANTSTLGLPNFIQTVGSPLQSPGMSVIGNCPNIPVSFSATPSDQYRDEYTWLVKTQSGAFVTSSTEQTFQHTFTTPGTYKVSLDITSDCSYPSHLVERFTQDLVINAPPPNPTFLIPPEDNSMCSPTKQLEALPASTPNLGNLSFLWTTAETTRPITIAQPGAYGVTVTDNNTGCTSSGSISIFDNRPAVDLGPDFPMCADEIRTLDASNPAATSYVWQIDNGAPVGTSQFLNINTALTGTHTYKVTVIKGACSDADDVQVTVNTLPTFTESVLVQPGCGASTGEIQVDITSAGTYTVDFSGPSANDVRVNQPTGTIVPHYLNLSAGTYNVIVTNDLTGCDAQDAVGLSNSTFTISPTYTPSCDPVGVVLNIAGGTAPYQYTFTNAVDGQQTAPAVYNGTQTNPVSPGDYVVEVRDNAAPQQCIVTADLTVDPGKNLVTFDFDPTCNTIEVINANAGSPTFQWSGPVGSISGITTDPIVTINPGTWAGISVEVGDATNALCPTTQSIDVKVDNTDAAAFAQSDPCTSPVVLTASPAGAYTYTWTESGAPIGSGRQLSLTTPGSYSITLNVSSNTTGCDLSPATNSVEVKDPITLSLTPSTACEGQEFTITATAVPSNASITWERNNVAIPSGVNPLVDNREGIYKAIATVAGCTPFTKQISIALFPVDEGQLPVTATYCDGTVTLDAGTLDNNSTYQWYKNNVLLDGRTEQTLEVDDQAIFSVDVTNTYGCTGRDETRVIRNCTPLLTAPTAFKPKNAQVQGNALFNVFYDHVSSEGFQIFIFNRWGEMVYQKSDRDFTWDGTNATTGAPLPPGVYSWVAKYKSDNLGDDTVYEKHGGVVLLR